MVSPMDDFLGDHLFSTLAIVLAGLYVAYFVIKYRSRAIGTTYRPDLPTPPGVPLLGNAPWLAATAERQLEYLMELRLKHGSPNRGILSLTAPFRRFVLITRPAHIEHMQKTNFENYVKGVNAEHAMGDILGRGIFVVDGQEWVFQRKTTSHIFNVNTFRGAISHSIQEHLATFFKLLANHAKSGEQLDLADAFFRFTLDSFVKMGFGQDLGVLAVESPQPEVTFARDFDYAQRVMAMRLSNPLAHLNEGINVPFFGYIEFKVGKEMSKAKRTLHDFCEKVITEKEQVMNADEVIEKLSDKRKGEMDLLSLFMAVRDERGQRLSKTQLRDVLLNLIIAGRDTTAQALSWCFFHLIKNPRLMDPIRQEIEHELGSEGPVTYDNYKTLKQALACLNETLRLHPAVPINVRTTQAEDQFPDDGPRIEKGDAILWSDWGMARDPQVWGDDCLEFKPSRWLDDQGKLKVESQWKFHTFNGGPRLCPGQNLATFEAISVMAELVRRFDFEFGSGWYESVAKTGDIAPGHVEEGVPLYEPSLTLPMKAPFNVVVKLRD